MKKATSEGRAPTGTKKLGTETAHRNSAATREKIRAAAEVEFADHGYDGCSVRQIAQRAGVPVALINYHFGNKEGLYRAIFMARASMIIDERYAGLQLAAMETDRERKVEMIVKAENGGEKLVHGSGGMELLRAA